MRVHIMTISSWWSCWACCNITKWTNPFLETLFIRFQVLFTEDTFWMYPNAGHYFWSSIFTSSSINLNNIIHSLFFIKTVSFLHTLWTHYYEDENKRGKHFSCISPLNHHLHHYWPINTVNIKAKKNQKGIASNNFFPVTR